MVIIRKRAALAYIAVSVSSVFHILALLFYVFKYDMRPSFTDADAGVLVLGSLLLAGVVTSFCLDSRLLCRIDVLIRLGLYFALSF